MKPLPGQTSFLVDRPAPAHSDGPTCPLCGSISRKFSRGPGAVMHCTAADCGQIFELLVSPRPRVEGGN
jgi:hypothetical protein